jgi:hypothetical protein
MKLTLAVIVMLCLASMSLFSSAFAQPNQASYTVVLNALTLQLTYPSEVMPGYTVTVSVQGTPNGYNLFLQGLTVTIYYADSTGLHQTSSQTLVSNSGYNYGAYNYGYYGGYSMSQATASFSKSITVSVPENAPRTSLIAVFSETVQSTYYNYAPYYYYSPASYGMGMHHHTSYFLFYYPSYSYSTATDQAIAPLSYIRANTPEFVGLQSEYQALQLQLNETQSQNLQLKTISSQQSSTINQLNQQLAISDNERQTYQTITLTLTALAVALAALNVYLWKTKRGGKPELGSSHS